MGVRWQIDYNEIFDEIDDVLDEDMNGRGWIFNSLDELRAHNEMMRKRMERKERKEMGSRVSRLSQNQSKRI